MLLTSFTAHFPITERTERYQKDYLEGVTSPGLPPPFQRQAATAFFVNMAFFINLQDQATLCRRPLAATRRGFKRLQPSSLGILLKTGGRPRHQQPCRRHDQPQNGGHGRLEKMSQADED